MTMGRVAFELWRATIQMGAIAFQFQPSRSNCSQDIGIVRHTNQIGVLSIDKMSSNITGDRVPPQKN